MSTRPFDPQTFRPRLSATHETKDYKFLKFFPWNRDLAERNVRDLMYQISRANLIYVRPIITNTKHFILDGQHRHEALKRMKLPIVYAVMTNCPKDHDMDVVNILNAVGRTWRPKDHVKLYKHTKNLNYSKVAMFAETHKIPLVSAKKLCSKIACKLNDFREGNYRYDNEMEALLVMRMVTALTPYYTEATLDRCLVGLRNLLYVEGFNIDHFINRIPTYAAKLHSCSNSENYAHMFIDEIYNKRLNVNDTIAYNRKRVQSALTQSRKAYLESLNAL